MSRNVNKSRDHKIRLQGEIRLLNCWRNYKKYHDVMLENFQSFVNLSSRARVSAGNFFHLRNS